MWNKIVLHPVVCIVGLIILSACKQEVVSQDGLQSLDKIKHQHLPGKPGANVSLKNSQPFYVSQTGVYDYEIDLVSAFSAGVMTVTVSTSNTVELVSPQSLFEFLPNAVGEYHLPLSIKIRDLGRHYIQLHISLNENGQVSTRAITAIVQAGDAPVKLKKNTSVSSASPDRVISLPAQETILSN